MSATELASRNAATGETPLADAADAFLASDTAHFATPGHKRNSRLVGDDPLLLNDTPYGFGVDHLRFPEDLLPRAQALAARAWGADWARFSVSGSTHSNQAASIALGKPGDRVIVARTSHKSVYAGLVLSGLEPVWVAPDVDPTTGLALSVPAGRVETALGATPDARGVYLVEPSYLGLVSDLEAIARAAHARGLPLVCDQAWGAHFGFHPLLPPCAFVHGADVVVTSVHKTLTAFSQGALLLAADSGRLDLDRLGASFDALLTTSPSAAIYASLDRARALVERDGRRLLWRAWALAEWFRKEIDGYRGARCLDSAVLRHASVQAWDPLKLIVDLSAVEADGFDVERDLRQEGVILEMADRTTLVPMLTIGDGTRSVRRLIGSLKRALDRRAGTAPVREAATAAWRVRPGVAMTPREAFFASHERVPAARATGRVAAEIIAPYPPGIPVLAPGEVIAADLLEALRHEARAGTRIAGASDPTLETLLVVG
jgi:arginine decarboxylase